MSRYLHALLLLLAIVFADENVVNTASGPISGFVTPQARFFKAIPFAQPPIGQLRWTPPQVASPWKPAILNATSDRPACPQACGLPPLLCPSIISEDCLYLDVVTPRLPSSPPISPWPVMVFFAGGAFEMGTPFSIIYDPQYLCNSSGVVVVLISYRIGALGFLVTESLNGNFGLLDQRLGLQWVQDNIAAFGGDPNQVLLFGESAGAMSTTYHMMMNNSKGLFHRAIIESNPLGIELRSNDEAIDYGAKLAAKINCSRNDLSCMRSVASDAIVSVQDSFFVFPNPDNLITIALPWAPTIDNIELFEQPLVAFSKGHYDTSIPFMIGTNAGESVLFIVAFLESVLKNYTSFDHLEYVTIATALFHTEVLKVLDRYPYQESDPLAAIYSLVTDLLFFCPSRRLTLDALSIGRSPNAHVYFFNHSLSFDAWGPSWEVCRPYACHGSELPFVFNSVQFSGNFSFTSGESALALQMSAYWTNFAHTGDPNTGPNSVSILWPEFASASLQTIQFAVPSVTIDDALRSQYCDFWDQEGYFW